MKPSLTYLRQMLCRCLSIMCLAAVAPAWAQNSKAEQARATAQQQKAVRDDAYAAIKGGNSAAAIVKLSENIQRGRRARDGDLQVADSLTEISSRFNNEGDAAHARETATLAIAKITQGRSRVSQSETARALAQAAQLYDHVLHDPAQARPLYEQALALDPTSKLAAERLAQLKAVEARAAEKNTANELLRQRAAEDKR